MLPAGQGSRAFWDAGSVCTRRVQITDYVVLSAASRAVHDSSTAGAPLAVGVVVMCGPE